MTPSLSDEQRQALANQPGEPLRVEDPDTQTQYVLVELGTFERLQRAFEFGTSEPDPRDYYAAFAEAVKEHLDDPAMEAYDEEAPPPNQP